MELPGEATPTSTAYGIKTMLLLEDGLAANLVPVAQSLMRSPSPRAEPPGRPMESGPRPEATRQAVLNALRRITATENFDAHIAQIQRRLGDFEKARPFILTTMLETSLLIKPPDQAPWRPWSTACWPRPGPMAMCCCGRGEGRALAGCAARAPSAAHAARAVRVLATVQATRPVQPGAGGAGAGGGAGPSVGDVTCTTRTKPRTGPVNGGLELVHIHHFTAAWVVKALVSAGVPAAHPVGEQRGGPGLERLRRRHRGPEGLGRRGPAHLDDLRRHRRAENRQPRRPGPARLDCAGMTVAMTAQSSFPPPQAGFG